MFNGWTDSLLAGIQTVNQILTAGIAITAFSLFLYALSFNLRDRVARSFAIILLGVVVVFATDALQTDTVPLWGIDLLLRLQWIGLVFLPAAYLHLSDAVLVTAGRPSRGRRRFAVRMTYLVSCVFLLLLGAGRLLGPLVIQPEDPAPHLQQTAWTRVFTLYYAFIMIWSWVNFARAYSRMLTRSGRRRMFYLMAGATAPALGSYPFLLYGSSIAAQHPLFFWSAAALINLAVGWLVVVMAYAVAFFGVSWPDRVVKSRLVKWIMRGPITASVALGVMTVVRRGGAYFGVEYNAFVPLSVVAVVLLFEHAITLVSPLWERWLFFGRDRAELVLLQNIEERLLTRGDLQQFLESVLAAVRDHMQSSAAFIAALDGEELSLIVTAGSRRLLEEESLSEALRVVEHENGNAARREFIWNDFLILPIYQRRRADMDPDQAPALLGLLGVARHAQNPLDADQRDALWLLAERAALALTDRQLQGQLFRSLEDLRPRADMLQRLRAVGRYDSRANLLAGELPPESDLANWVKDALAHYWGGPKLTQSPLIKLQVVQELADEHAGNSANALRALLRKAVDRVRPEGERRYTSEWTLFNILEMKFIEGRKVREVASRLAMSEADLYRKQRVAVEAVARAILEMESEKQLLR
ncbi:MAG: hypothetical protein PGMFKBFP_03351 [Anaerolineales bacterium]|nr:hypothetical protein [Anaerolineales bacterium]MBW7918226.1 hypothetical protein [Anaerolineales bacterium]MCZ2290254.1 hypothetical protein [Anaerolineales bacterium]WKZ49933.1 MAG: hypothetical protein QY329_10775 [Anaerolineales bacterium]GIK10682.1 MAG: hypothetical protein BroJett001_27480 [Chloroflexota bacterium]